MKHAVYALTFAAASALLCDGVNAFAASPTAMAPPTGTQILARAKAASGGAAWDHIHSLRIESTLKIGGLSGSETSLQDLLTGRSVTHYKLGPISGAQGFNGTLRWSKSPNGNISTQDTSAAKKRAVTFAYQTERAWWYPQRWPAAIETLGTKMDDEKTFRVLKITPRGGDSFKMWINAKTHLIARLVYHTPVDYTTYMSDYRTVHDVKIPFHSRSTAGHGQVAQVKKVTANVPVSDGDFAVPGQQGSGFSFIGGGSVATISFTLVDNHIHIPVKINGHPFDFILDSGSVNVLSPQAAKAAGVKAKGKLAAHGAGAKTVDMGLAKVKDVVLGGKIALHDQTFYVIPLPSVSTATRLDGTVGYGIFEHFVVRIDYAKHLLTLIRPKDFDPKGAGEPVSLHFYNGNKVTVKGAIDGLPGYFILDTGNSGSLVLFEPFAKKNGLYARYHTTPPVITGFGVGGVTRGRVARGGRLAMGHVMVKNPVITLSTSPRGTPASKNLAGNIGARILKRFTVTFDYANKLMYIKPNKNHGKPMNYDRSGMAFKQTQQGFPVVGILKGGPAAQAGIEIGDVITAVNGKPANDMTRLAFRAMLRNEAPGTKVKLTIGEGKTAHAVTITLRRLIPKTGGLKKAA